MNTRTAAMNANSRTKGDPMNSTTVAPERDSLLTAVKLLRLEVEAQALKLRQIKAEAKRERKALIALGKSVGLDLVPRRAK
jgi:hypothetical protein